MIARKILWQPGAELIVMPQDVTPEQSSTALNEAIMKFAVAQQPGIGISVTNPASEIVGTPTGAVAWQPRAYKKRVGNGHKKAMVRKLCDTEKDQIKNFLFLPKNGMIEDDDCVKFKYEVMPSEIAIFQVTGFVSLLHDYVAQGQIGLKDLNQYVNWMDTKYHDTKWARFYKPEYVKVRGMNQTLVEAGLTPSNKVEKPKKDYKPKFATYPA